MMVASLVAETIAVLFSAGLDSAVLLAEAARRDVEAVQPIYVSAGLAWEAEELAAATRLLASGAYGPRVLPLVSLSVDMRDVYPPGHWAVRGEAPASDTPDEDVYLEGRNVVLLSKAAVYMARAGISRVLIGPLAGNPFPDATAANSSTRWPARSRSAWRRRSPSRRHSRRSTKRTSSRWAVRWPSRSSSRCRACSRRTECTAAGAASAGSVVMGFGRRGWRIRRNTNP